MIYWIYLHYVIVYILLLTKMLTFMVDHTHILSIFIGDQGIEDASTYSTSSVRISHTCIVPYCLSWTQWIFLLLFKLEVTGSICSEVFADAELNCNRVSDVWWFRSEDQGQILV